MSLNPSLRPAIETALTRLPDVLADAAARQRALVVADRLPAAFTSGPIGLELRLAGPAVVDLFAAAIPGDATFAALVSGLRAGGWASNDRADDLADVLERWQRREGALPVVARYLLVEADAPDGGANPPVPSIFLAPRANRDAWRAGQPLNAFQRLPDATVMAAAELSGVWPDPATAAALAAVAEQLPDEVDIFAVGAMISRDAGSSLRVAIRRFTPDFAHDLLVSLGRPRQAEVLTAWAAGAPSCRQALAFEVGPGAEDRVGLELAPDHDWKEARLDGWPELLDYVVAQGVADPDRAAVVAGLVDPDGDPRWGLAHVKVAANGDGLLPVSKLYVGLSHDIPPSPASGASRQGSAPKPCREAPLADLEEALARLDTSLGPRGQWPGEVVHTATGVAPIRDLSAPLTALGVLALTGVPGAESIIQRSLEHIRLTVQPGGMWRYYANIPVDTDDSAMCALALGPDDPIVADTRATLAGMIRPDGLFPTWVEPGWNPCVDAVANAHIVGVLGPGPLTDRAVAWLHDAVTNGRETASCVFYPDPLDLHMAITRAYRAGVAGLGRTQEIAAQKSVERLGADEDLSAYRLAQAIVVAGDRVVGGGRERLLALRRPDGTWPADTLYAVGNTEHGGLSQYQSWAVVTALALRALTL